MEGRGRDRLPRVEGRGRHRLPRVDGRGRYRLPRVDGRGRYRLPRVLGRDYIYLQLNDVVLGPPPLCTLFRLNWANDVELLMKHAPSGFEPATRSPVSYHWTTAPARDHLYRETLHIGHLAISKIHMRTFYLLNWRSCFPATFSSTVKREMLAAIIFVGFENITIGEDLICYLLFNLSLEESGCARFFFLVTTNFGELF